MTSRYGNLIESILDDTLMEPEYIPSGNFDEDFTLDDILNHLENGGEVIVSGVSEHASGEDINLSYYTQESSDYPYQSGRSWMNFIIEEGRYGSDSATLSIHPNAKGHSGLYVVYSTVESTGLDEDEYPDSFQTGYNVIDVTRDDNDNIIIEVEEDPSQSRHMIH